MKKVAGFFVSILLMIFVTSCVKEDVDAASDGKVTSGAGASSDNALEGTWTLKNVLMGDAMDMPCGFGSEGKVRDMNITFTSDKTSGGAMKLSGQSSVNTFFAEYNIESFDTSSKVGKIKMGAIGSTKIGGDSILMACENRYFSFLQNAVKFTINSDNNNKIEVLQMSYSISGVPGGVFGGEYTNTLFFERPLK
jgi:hypothetical protein